MPPRRFLVSFDVVCRGLAAALRGLEGDWRVETLYIAVGTREKPAVSSDLIARRHWIAGGRFLHDVTEGSIAGGPYYRMGVLGYSNEDAR